MATVDILHDATYPRITAITTAGAAAPYDVDVGVEAIVVKAVGWSTFEVTAQLWLMGAGGAASQIGGDIPLDPDGIVANRYFGTFETIGSLQPGDFVFVKVSAVATYQVNDSTCTVPNVVPA